MIDSRILVGLIAVLISISSIVYVGINEPSRQEEFKATFQGRKVAQGAALFEEYCSPCHGIKGQGIEGVAPALNTQFFFEQRLDEIGYQGSLESYVRLTVAGGRPAQSTSGPWPQNMPTWSQRYGGPLREDQVDAVTAFVMSWGEFATEAGEPGAAPTPVPGDTPEERGRNLFQGMGCIGCHKINGEGGAVGPELTNVYGEKGEDYIHQSIIQPNAVIAEGYQPNLMPQIFGERLSEENLSDIIAYLASVSE
jgi:cbb3-type cytochrome c oxidase subunit III